MKVILDSVDENIPKLIWGRIIGFASDFDLLVFDISKPDLTVILGDKVRDFTSGKNHVDEFEEVFVSDFLISHKESRGEILMAS